MYYVISYVVAPVAIQSHPCLTLLWVSVSLLHILLHYYIFTNITSLATLLHIFTVIRLATLFPVWLHYYTSGYIIVHLATLLYI